MHESFARAVSLLIIPVITTLFLFLRYSCLRRKVAVWTWLGTLAVAMATATYRYHQPHLRVDDDQLDEILIKEVFRQDGEAEYLPVFADNVAFMPLDRFR